LSGRVSIVRDFYGYRTKPPLTLSLLAQVRLLQGKHIHLNLIRTASFNVSQEKEIDFGLQITRNIYATVNMGIGRIQRFFIPPGYEVIDGDSGAEDLWNEYSVQNASIDVFLARLVFGDSVGKSKVKGSCDKDSKNDSGCVIGVEDNSDGLGLKLGQAIAHEVGHYLGLEHEDDLPDNLMFPRVPNGGKLYGGQGGVMVLHCSVDGGCRT
jgi:Metallo-peptidase family M12B Reprolysin-like